jgi:hypothetical protein
MNKPLTKEKVHPDNVHVGMPAWIAPSDLLSALQGLKEEFRAIESFELEEGNTQYGLMAGTSQALVDRWFPILNDVHDGLTHKTGLENDVPERPFESSASDLCTSRTDTNQQQINVRDALGGSEQTSARKGLLMACGHQQCYECEMHCNPDNDSYENIKEGRQA